MKKTISVLLVITLLFTVFAVYSFASEEVVVNDSIMIENKEGGDKIVKKMVSDLNKGVFSERNDLKTISPRELFQQISKDVDVIRYSEEIKKRDDVTNENSTVDIKKYDADAVAVARSSVESQEYDDVANAVSSLESETFDVSKIHVMYDNRATGNPKEFMATRATAVELRKEETASGSDDCSRQIVIYSRMIYKLLSLSSCEGVMLMEVGGGLERNYSSDSDYYCSSLQLGYKVYGSAFDESGNNVGFKSNENPIRVIQNNPQYGTYYYMYGPRDYYYQTGVKGTAVGGLVDATVKSKRDSAYKSYINCSLGFANDISFDDLFQGSR